MNRCRHGRSVTLQKTTQHVTPRETTLFRLGRRQGCRWQRFGLFRHVCEWMSECTTTRQIQMIQWGERKDCNASSCRQARRNQKMSVVTSRGEWRQRDDKMTRSFVRRTISFISVALKYILKRIMKWLHSAVQYSTPICLLFHSIRSHLTISLTLSTYVCKTFISVHTGCAYYLQYVLVVDDSRESSEVDKDRSHFVTSSNQTQMQKELAAPKETAVVVGWSVLSLCAFCTIINYL